MPITTSVTRLARCAIAAGLLASALGGCSVYDGRYEFEPRPTETLLQTPGATGPAARTLVSVTGIRRASQSEGTGPSVELRVRIDNVGGTPLIFDPAAMTLLSADLQQFPRPRTEPGGSITVPPNSSGSVTTWFAFPDDPSRPPMDLSGLSLQWTIEVDGRPVPGSVTFKRRRYYANHDWVHAWHFGYGRGYRGYGAYGYNWCR